MKVREVIRRPEDDGWYLVATRGTGVPRGHPGVKFYSFEIVIEKGLEDEGYLAYSPTLPGCFSSGKTIEDAKRNIREAIQQHIASLLAHGQPIPQHERLVHVEELTVGVP